MFLFKSSDGAFERCWEKSGGDTVLTVSVGEGITGGEGRRAPSAGSGLAVEEDHGNEERAGLRRLRPAGRLGDFISRGSVESLPPHVSGTSCQ